MPVSGIGELNNQFKQQIGRDLTPEETKWIEDNGPKWNSKDYGSGYAGAAKEYTVRLKERQDKVINEANALGIKNFDPKQAQSVVDSFYHAGSNENLDDYFRAKLSTIKTEQLQNPYKYAGSDQQTKYQSDAARIIETTLGRKATPDELDFYAGKLAEGEKPFEMAQFLQQTPEFQDAKAAKENARVKGESDAARQALSDQLLTSQNEAFKRAVPNILSSYMKAGRINSSGVDSAIALQAKDLEAKRQDYMAGLGYQDAVRAQGYSRDNFVQNQGQAFQTYLRDSDPYAQRNSALTQLGYTLPFQQQADRTDRSRQVEDYYRQQSDYERYLSESRKQQREAALYGLAGNVIGAGVGAYTYGKAK